MATYWGTFVYFPTNILQGMGGMLFFWVGQLFRERLPEKPSIYVICLGIIMLSASLHASYMVEGKLSPMSMVRCYYSYYPVNVMAAIYCTYFIYVFSNYIIRWKIFSSLLSYWGRTSLLILCVHIVDLNYGCGDVISNRLLGLEGREAALFTALWHIVAALGSAYLLGRFSFVRRFYQIKCK